MSDDRTITNIARDLAHALEKAAQRDNTDDEAINKLEQELVNAYRAEAVETLRVPA